jgi:hypothetical protein
MAVLSTPERFPLELRQALLSALSDVSSLRSTALSCPSFYDAFTSAEELITTQVLNNQLENTDILPEAVAAFNSSRMQPWSSQRTRDFVDAHFHSRRAPPDSWKLVDALPIGNLHSCVEFFATRFVAEMFSPSSTFAYIDPPSAWPLSRNEMIRIQRTFYRFEVYCNLFRNPERFDFREQRDLFFFKFSHWENEQLACVYDYLFRVICPGMIFDGPSRDSSADSKKLSMMWLSKIQHGLKSTQSIQLSTGTTSILHTYSICFRSA